MAVIIGAKRSFQSRTFSTPTPGFIGYEFYLPAPIEKHITI